MADHKGCWGSHVRDFHLLVTLWAIIQGMHLHGASVSILRSLQATWTNKMDVKVAIPWNSLVKFLTK